MTPAEFLATLTGAPASFADIAGRLEAAHAAGGALWTPAKVCDVVNECFADFDHATLTGNQMMRAGSLINALWLLYPLQNVGRLNAGQTRATVLSSYLGGEYDAVAGLRLPDPSQTTWPARDDSPKDDAPRTTDQDTPPPPTNRDNSYHTTFSPQPTPHTALPPLPHDLLGARAESFRGGQTNARAVVQYYTKNRQYGGGDTESLPRARSTFYMVCDAFGVAPRARADCVAFAPRHSDHNLPELVADNRGASAETLWHLIDQRVSTTARTLRIKAEWHAATLGNQPKLPGDDPVTRFERMLARLTLLQSQLPPRYHATDYLTDKLLLAVKGE